MHEVLRLRDEFCYKDITSSQVEDALGEERLSIKGLQALLSPAAQDFLEPMAQRAKELTFRHFGNSVELFTPLYISNFCDSNCTYCGFSSHNKISRLKLSEAQIATSLENIAKTGLKDILILTGENAKKRDLDYIGKACKMASEFFSNVGIEIYPLNADEYAFLHKCGADYVVIFQETYNAKNYANFHLGGHKMSFAYRFNAQERALMGGMRSVGFGALLGLDDFRKDAFAVALHAYFIQRKYPHAELSISCPRLRPAINKNEISANDVDERKLFQSMCAYRIFLPYANIVISTREKAKFRNGVIGTVATKISGGVSVGIGTHAQSKSHGDEQFEISDTRSVSQMMKDIENLGLQAVMSNHIYV
ncbi:MAG: 2-iminoacetate synthase ThiH [Campylobacter sp.]|nr:2-iminoacetate synthase ThiH [Campylobacter sp.]